MWQLYADFSRICKKSWTLNSPKIVDFQNWFLLKNQFEAVQKVFTSCRIGKFLKKAYFLAKIHFDTAEKEPAKKLKKFALFLHCQRFVSTMPVPLTLVKIPQVPELLGAEADAALRRYFRCIFFTEYQRNSEFRMHEQTGPASYARLTECEQ